MENPELLDRRGGTDDGDAFEDSSYVFLAQICPSLVQLESCPARNVLRSLCSGLRRQLFAGDNVSFTCKWIYLVKCHEQSCARLCPVTT